MLQAARRSRGLRGALLPGARSPEGGGDAPRGRDRAATRARAASPSCCSRWARPTCTWATRSARRRRSQRVVAEYGGAPQARRAELYLEFIAQRYGAEPRCKTPPTATPATAAAHRDVPWMTASRRPARAGRARARALRGRRVRRGRALPHRGAAREGALRRRLRHAGRHLSPGRGAWRRRRRCSSEALRINPAYTEAALNLAVTYNDLGKYARGQGGLRSGRWRRRKQRAARAGPVRQGQDRQHARRRRRRLPRVGAVRGGRARVRAGAGAVPDVRRHPHRLGTTLREMGDTDGRRSASSSGCARRTRASSRARLQLGLVLLRGRRGATTPPPSGAPCWRPSRRTSAAQDVPRAAATRRPRRTRSRPDGRDRQRAVLTFTPSPDRFVVEEIPAYAPSRRGRRTRSSGSRSGG